MAKLPLIGALLFTTPVAAQSAGTTILVDGRTPAGRSQTVTEDRGAEPVAGTRVPSAQNGGYVAPSAGFTYVNGGASMTLGLRGAWRINRQFGLGFAATGFEFEDDAIASDLEAGYGGVLFEYVLNSDDVAHAVLDATIGGGAWCSSAGRYDCDGHQAFFFAEPTFSMELNLTSFLRAGVGGGYRLAIAQKRRGISSSDLIGFVGRVSLAVGQF